MKRFGAVVILSLLPVVADAQVAEVASDSLRMYHLGEIVIGETARRDVDPAAVRRVPLAEIVRSDAPSVSAVSRLVPAAYVQTNSRGETLVYLRGAGERQVAVYLDGALLNVPWDNRVDLSFIPSAILGSIGVAHGASSVLYGTNTVGGVLLLAPRSLEAAGSLTEVSAAGGTVGWNRFEAMHQVRGRQVQFLAAGGWSSASGLPVPRGADLPFEPASSERVNTDRRLGHLFVRGAWQRERLQVVGSVLHADGTQGVAPEGHLDPSVESVRYWRYPWWRMTMGTAGVVADLGRASHVRATGWVSRFGQRIDQFTSVDYGQLDGRQEDADMTMGGRVTLDHPFVRGTLVTALNVHSSGHDQTDSSTDGAGVIDAGDVQGYRLNVWSVGSEYRRTWSDRLRSQIGIGMEGMSTPETGDKPPQAGQSSWTASAGFVADLGHDWSARLATGRKLRFATPRELFGTALGHFLVNPDLRPESSWSVDLGAVRTFEEAEIEATVFLRRTLDTIEQENVKVDGRTRRRRVNLDGSSTLGLEVAGRLEPSDGFEIEGHVTVMRGRVTGQPGRTRLVEKPDVLSTLAASWVARSGFAATVQGTYTGRAWGLGPDNAFVALPRALSLDLRVAYRRMVAGGVFAEVFARVDNVFDTLMMPQLGLPAAGRSARAGLGLTF